MKIVISGYGRMGREIERAALSRGHEILARLDKPEDWALQEGLIRQAGVVIDFSLPSSVALNIRRCFDLHLPLVVGTTGWDKDLGTVKKWCMDEQQALFFAPNYSLGIYMMSKLAAELAKFIDRLEDYEISLEEVHHVHKLDSPSGTAIRLAQVILENTGRKQKWVNRSQANPEELEIISIRENEVPGIHTIFCESKSDRLILKHEARGREGFAAGALLAAEWLPGRQGFFGMDDLLNKN